MWWQHTADNKGIAIERTQVVNKRKTTSNDTFFVSTLLHKYPLNTNIVHSTVYKRFLKTGNGTINTMFILFNLSVKKLPSFYFSFLSLS